MSHLKHLKICTELYNQYISVLQVRILSSLGLMNYWIADKHPSVYKREILYLTRSVFSNYDTHFYGMVFKLLAVDNLRS